MKKEKLIYWITTGLVAVVMFLSGISYFYDSHMIEEIKGLGFPDYFRVELGIAKTLGALALMIPYIPSKIKEFAYFGFQINFISAIVAHISIGNPTSEIIPPVIFTVILILSYHYYQKLKLGSYNFLK